jgi:hypothetical protein
LSPKNIAVGIVFKVFLKMVCAFKCNHRRDMITTHRDTFYKCNKLLILGIINIDDFTVGRNDNKRPIDYTNHTSYLIKVVSVIVDDSLVFLAPIKLNEVGYDIFSNVCSLILC